MQKDFNVVSGICFNFSAFQNDNCEIHETTHHIEALKLNYHSFLMREFNNKNLMT
jgi:hypothetical protein